MNKVGIVITMCNQVDYTKRCVETIKSSTPYVLILIDDYSIDGTKNWIASLKKEQLENCVEIIPVIDPDTSSLGEKWNIGMEKAIEAGCESSFICNNDILFHPKTIDNVIARYELARKNNEPVVLVTASNKRGECSPETLNQIVIEEPGTEAPHPDFSCFLLSSAAWKTVGKFSTKYIPCYFEDNDFHTMLQIHDLVAIAISSAPYYHYGSITQNQVPNGLCSSPQFERNRAIFVSKFGYPPEKIDIKELKERLGSI